MTKQILVDETLLNELNETVDEAARFFTGVDENLCDGNQSAREVLSHLVFWHQEYATIAESLAEGRRPLLREGAFSVLNAHAVCLYRHISLPELARRLLSTQDRLDMALRSLPDWSVNFPVKVGGRFWKVADRLEAIESHIRNHVVRLRRRQRRSPAWLEAYNGVMM
jgi:hypothetical protein